MNFYYVYVLHFNNDRKFYAGYTKNLKLRLEQHRKERVESTKNRGLFKLIYFEGCLNQQDATRREKYLKTYHGKMFLYKRLKSYLTGEIKQYIVDNPIKWETDRSLPAGKAGNNEDLWM